MLPGNRSDRTFRSHFNRHPNDFNKIQNRLIQAAHPLELGAFYQFLHVLQIISHVLFILN